MCQGWRVCVCPFLLDSQDRTLDTVSLMQDVPKQGDWTSARPNVIDAYRECLSVVDKMLNERGTMGNIPTNK